MNPRATYHITVYYREPFYELRNGRRERPYRWSRDLEAESPGDAHEKAVAEFKTLERRSSVNWARDIVAVEIEGGGAQAPSGDSG